MDRFLVKTEHSIKTEHKKRQRAAVVRDDDDDVDDDAVLVGNRGYDLHFMDQLAKFNPNLNT